MLVRSGRRKYGTVPSSDPTRFRSTACAGVIGTPRSETTRSPTTRLPRVWPLRTTSQNPRYPHISTK